MFTYDNLDPQTRQLMLEELAFDVMHGQVYLCVRLLEGSEESYLALLKEALSSGTPESFADAIGHNSMLKKIELRTKNGRQFPVDVPYTAHVTLAEGEFNRFYVRALCLRALKEGLNTIEIYRAKPVRAARSQSERLIGTYVNTENLLRDLRSNIGVDTALGVPAGPNSGLSVRIKSN